MAETGDVAQSGSRQRGQYLGDWVPAPGCVGARERTVQFCRRYRVRSMQRPPPCGGGRRFLGCQSDTGGGEFAAVEMGLKPLLGVEQFRAVFQLCSSCASGTSSALAGDRLCIAGGMHRRHLMTQYPALVSGRDGSCTVAAAHFQWRVPSSGGNTLDKGCRYRALGGARGRAVQVAGCSEDVYQVCQGETTVG